MISTQLRDSTKDLHEATESAFDVRAALASHESYAAILARFYGIHEPIESQLREMPMLDDLGLDIVSRRKSLLIERDLRSLGWAEDAIGCIPKSNSLPRLTSVPEALGSMYVLEGSTLGGQIIRREVEKRLGFTPDRGCAFFAGYGDPGTRENWTQFIAALNAYADSHPETSDAIREAACRMFVAVKDWLSLPESTS